MATTPATTPNYSWTYFDEYEDPWYAKFVLFANAVDAKCYALEGGLHTGTAYKLAAYTATNTLTELAAVGATGEYLKGNTGAIPSWATLNQAAIPDLTTTSGPTFAHLHISDLAAITTAAESWIGPSSTTGVYFKGNNVGVRVTNPGYPLEVLDTLVTKGNSSNIYTISTGADSTARIWTQNDAVIWAFGVRGDLSDSWIISNNSTGSWVDNVTVLKGGNVGIAQPSPTTLTEWLAVDNTTVLTVKVNESQANANATILDIRSTTGSEGTIVLAAGGGVTYNAFVGSHYTQLKEGQAEFPVGAVVIGTGEIIPSQYTDETTAETEVEIAIGEAFENEVVEASPAITKQVYVLDGEEIKIDEVIVRPEVKGEIKRRLKSGIEFDPERGRLTRKMVAKTTAPGSSPNKEYFPYVDTTGMAGDARVYGVWFGKMVKPSKMTFGKESEPVYLIAQTGLFKIRVTDTNGNIVNGDYLETSSRPMEAQKQNLREKLNSTVAKSMVDVTWENEPIDPVLGYKFKLIPCIF